MLRALRTRVFYTAGMLLACTRFHLPAVACIVMVLPASGRAGAQDAKHMADVVVSFGPQVLSWQELRAEMLRASGGVEQDASIRVEGSSKKLKKAGRDRVSAAPAVGPGKTMAEVPPGKVRTIRGL